MITATEVKNPATGKVNGAENQYSNKLFKNNSIKLNLSRTLSGGVGNTELKPFDLTLTEFGELTKPGNIPTGPKDGPYFVRGRCEGKRSDKGFSRNTSLLVIIDGDSSITEDGEITEGAPDPRQVHEVLKQANVDHLIYTSHSHQKNGAGFNKWRALIPSNATIDSLTAGVDAVIDLLYLGGIKVAPVKENYCLSQPWYFPRVAPSRAGGYYSAIYEAGKQFKVPVVNPEPKRATRQIKSQRSETSVIDAWCARYPISQELPNYGYKWIRENRYLPASSTSGQAGAIVLTGEDGKERVYIHNGSDPLHGRSLDSFDLYCEFHHQGVFKDAVKAAASELGMVANTGDFGQFIATEVDTALQEPKTLPVDIANVDITKPPGLAGSICMELRATAKRPLNLTYPIVALQALSLVGGHRKGIGGIKLNLQTLAIAPSASGKEHGQSWLARMAAELKLGRHIAGNIASHKDMIENLVDAKGRCCYKIDEIQGLFNSVQSKNANTYETKIMDFILTLVTAELYSFIGNHRRDLLKRTDLEIDQLKNKIKKAEKNSGNETSDINPDYARDIGKLNKEMHWLFKRKDLIENGWPDPLVSIMGHSTPNGLDKLITEENINSGLIGRCIVIRCAEHREQLQDKKVSGIFDKTNILKTLSNINTGSQHQIKVSTQAQAMLTAITKYYDEDERLNAPLVGAIYARAIEQINKVASLLALENGLVELDHVRYAFALISRSIDDILFLLRKSEALKTDATSNEIAQHTREIIKRAILTTGTTPSRLKQVTLKNYTVLKKLIADHARSHNLKDQPDLFDQVLNSMVAIGEIEFREEGKKKRYFLK